MAEQLPINNYQFPAVKLIANINSNQKNGVQCDRLVPLNESIEWDFQVAGQQNVQSHLC
jgi:hypothetical protein